MRVVFCVLSIFLISIKWCGKKTLIKRFIVAVEAAETSATLELLISLPNSWLLNRIPFFLKRLIYWYYLFWHCFCYVLQTLFPCLFTALSLGQASTSHLSCPLSARLLWHLVPPKKSRIQKNKNTRFCQEFTGWSLEGVSWVVLETNSTTQQHFSGLVFPAGSPLSVSFLLPCFPLSV